MASREEYRKFIITPQDAVAYSPPRHQETTNYLYLGKGQLGNEKMEIVVGGPRPGGGGEPHFHDGVDQIIFVLAGNGLSEMEGEQFEIGPHTLVYHPAGQVHRELAVSDDFKCLVVYVPPVGLLNPESFKQR